MVAIKKIAWLVLLAAGLSHAQPLVIQKSSVFVPNHLGEVNLLHDDDGFHVMQNGKNHDVQNCFIDEGLRKVDCKKLAAFLKHGYIAVNKVGDDDFSLRAQVRGPGGGPIAAKIVYWAVKGACYGIGVAGASIIRNPNRSGTSGASNAAFAHGVQATIAGAAGGGAGVAGYVGSAIEGGGYAQEAAMTTALAGTAAAGTLGGIEALAVAASAWALTWPTP